jgi:hypothetical protein
VYKGVGKLSWNRAKSPHVSESLRHLKGKGLMRVDDFRKHFCLRHVKQPESKKPVPKNK